MCSAFYNLKYKAGTCDFLLLKDFNDYMYAKTY